MHFTAPFVAALAAFGATAEAARATCNRKAYSDVASQIQNPAYFCKFYLKQARTNSPLPGYGHKQLTNLCRCFVQNSPRVAGPYAPLHPKPAPTTCEISLYRSLKNQYKDPVAFCRWYDSIPRKLSPLPAFQNPATVKKACSCYINQEFAPQQATSSMDQPQSTAAPSSSSTDDSESTTTTTSSSDLAGGVSATPATTTTSSRPTTTIAILPTIAMTTSTTLATTTSTTTSSTTSSTTSAATSSTTTAATTAFTSSVTSSTSSATSAATT